MKNNPRTVVKLFLILRISLPSPEHCFFWPGYYWNWFAIPGHFSSLLKIISGMSLIWGK